MPRHKVIIIGAGVAGLAAGWRLVERGITDAIMLEAGATVGGLSRSPRYGSFIFDLGPHQIHTENQRVIGFLRDVLKDDLIVERKKAAHWFLGRYLNYPLGINDILFGLPLTVSASCFFDFCLQALKNCFVAKRVDSFESWVISHFGRRMYDIYFGPYTQKVWGRHPSQMAAICAAERIAVQNLFDVLVSALSRKMVAFRHHYHLPHSPYQRVFYYPRYGIGQLCDIMRHHIAAQGVAIKTGTPVVGIAKTGEGYTVTTGDGRAYDAAQVISTMPVDELKDRLTGAEAAKPSTTLAYRALTFLFLQVERPQVSDNHWIYFPDRDCIFQRTCEFKNFSRAMSPADKTGICVEIPCDYEDPVWNMPDDTLFARVMQSAEQDNYVRREWVVAYHVAREQYAYPTYDLTYAERLRTILAYLEAFPGLLTIGRQGLFRYINIDEVLLMGFDAADKIA